MTDVHSQCLCSCNLSPHSVKAVCWKSRVSLYTQDFTMLLFSCVLTSCCRLSFHIKFYSYLFLLFDLIEFQLSRKRCGIGLSCNYIETRKLNVNNFFLLTATFFLFFFLPISHASFITSSLGEDSWSLGQYGGVFLSCTDKLNRRTLLVRPISKQDPFSNFSGFFPSVRILLKFLNTELSLINANKKREKTLKLISCHLSFFFTEHISQWYWLYIFCYFHLIL